MECVRYSGRVTHYLPSLGLRVWFDGYSASEQEWVNEGDEWDWEEACEPPQQTHLGAHRRKVLHTHAESPLPLTAEYHTVRLRIRSERGDSVQMVRLPADPNNGPVALRSSLSLSAHESSPRKFGKKARLLKSVEDQQSGVGGTCTPDMSRDTLWPRAPCGLMAPPPTVGKATSEGTSGESYGLRQSAVMQKRSRENARIVSSTGQVEVVRAAKQPKKAQAAILKLRIDARGVQLLVPTAAKGLFDGLLTLRTTTEPLPSAMQKYGACSYSGQPAYYRDPLTGMRYGSLEAFKQLRAEHVASKNTLPAA